MFDRFNRKIDYLRISVTDRCNLRCIYCMPAEGIPLIRHEDILSYEKIVEVVREAVKLGIRKVRITGGEPLVRKGVTHLVEMISGIEGIQDLGLTTNGILLETFAADLAKAGLKRINISLDTTDPEKFKTITRGGDIQSVFRGIEAAKKAGLSPVKINCVVHKSSSEPDALQVKEFCNKNGLEVRFIHEMDLESGCFTVVEGGNGGNCKSCNRLRLTADGMIKPCLFSNLSFSIRELGIREALVKAIELKPEKGTVNTLNRFNNIGG
ncbi:MAG: GTP 3',8-cyclase MoaA [Bacteroidota bacterium]|nr:GTP 3',8-cyclase MoaA [Bacteroidota bacterium]